MRITRSETTGSWWLEWSPWPPSKRHRPRLPSNLINDVMVGGRGRVWVATDSGIAWSNNRGRSFTYLRGGDWLAKLKGLYHAPSHSKMTLIKSHWRGRKIPALSEDYTTCLAQDHDGRIWIGHRRTGFDVLNLTKSELFNLDKPPPGKDYVKTIMTMAGRSPWIGYYQGGLTQLSSKFQSSDVSRFASSDASKNDQAETPALPSSVAAPTQRQLQALLTRIKRVPAASRGRFPLVTALDDDWRTRGNWLGRYGKYWACLAAICSPHDYVWGAGKQPIEYFPQIGPHRTKDDSLRRWVHWLYTNNPDSLEMPPTYLHSRVLRGNTTWKRDRRQASWDDHGEAYPATYLGPHVYLTLKVPQGQFVLSIYDFNKDGFYGDNRFRDFRLSIRPQPRRAPIRWLGEFEARPELARGRIHDFRGGVYKRFFVQGPQSLTLQMNSNYSFDTIWVATFLDQISPFPDPYFKPAVRKAFRRKLEQSHQLPARILLALRKVRQRNPRWWAGHRVIYAQLLRYLLHTPDKSSTHQKTLAACLYQTDLLTRWESTQKTLGLTPARTIEKSLRWDQTTWSCSGKGRAIVTQYLSDQATSATTATAETDKLTR